MVVYSGGGQHPPVLANTKTGVFSRTTDCVIPSSLPVQFVAFCASPQQLSALQMNNSSVDEGFETELSERESLNSSESGSCLYPSSSNLAPSGKNDVPRKISLNRGNAFSNIVSMCQASVSTQSVSSSSDATNNDLSVEYSELSFGSEEPELSPARNLRSPVINYCSTTPSSPRHSPVSRPRRNLSVYQRPPITCLGTSEDSEDRTRNARSPVSFREGRRASDGLMPQGLVAFHQRLVESKGLPELKRELDSLQTYYKVTLTPAEQHEQQVQHCLYLGQSNSVAGYSGISVSDGNNGTVQLNDVEMMQRHAIVSQQKLLVQSQLVQQRLQTRRAAFQRHANPVMSSPLTMLHQKFQQMEIISPTPPQTTYVIPPLHRPSSILPADLSVSPMTRRNHLLHQQQHVSSSFSEPDQVGIIQQTSVTEGATPLSPMFEVTCEEEAEFVTITHQ